MYTSGMSLINALKKNWAQSSILTKWTVAAGLGLAVLVVFFVSVTTTIGMDGGTSAVSSQVPSTTSLSTPTATQSQSTPTPSASEPEPEPTTVSHQAPVVQQGAVAPTAPVFDALSATAYDYGIGSMMDNGPGTFPTGRIYAVSPLPTAQGTGPISYAVSGLPVGAGFDTDQRKVFIDAETFIPANQENYLFNFCYQRQRVNFATSVQYTATGPGGQAVMTVPLQFGALALGAGIIHAGC